MTNKREPVRWADFFAYDPSTGILAWKVKRPGPKTAVGMEVGSVKHDGRYRTFVLFHKRYYTHRVIWELINGEIPVGMCIDHIDGDGLNNRLDNLRLATLSMNQRNAKFPRNNRIGIIGVYPKKNGFVARCASQELGYFGDFFEACCARKSAELRNGYHENHGRK